MGPVAPCTPQKQSRLSSIHKSPIKSGLTDTCAICLGSMQIRAVLNNCVHSFCLDCITQWGESFVTNCPICKTEFQCLQYVNHTEECLSTTLPIICNQTAQTLIELSPISRVTLRHNCKCEIQRKELLPKMPSSTVDPLFDLLACQICSSGENEDVQLLCDGCNAGYHTYCVALDVIPENEWFCPHCTLEIQRLVEQAQERRQKKVQGKKKSGSKRSRVCLVQDEFDEDVVDNTSSKEESNIEQRVDLVRVTRSRTRSNNNNNNNSNMDDDSSNHNHNDTSVFDSSTLDDDTDELEDNDMQQMYTIVEPCVLVDDGEHDGNNTNNKNNSTTRQSFGRTMYMEIDSNASTESVPNILDL